MDLTQIDNDIIEFHGKEDALDIHDKSDILDRASLRPNNCS